MIEAVGVVLPVHDEADHLGECLASIGAAARRLPGDVARVTIVVLDACTDGSEDIARRWAEAAPDGTREVVEAPFRNVGLARAAGMDRALAALRGGTTARTWLATTDADSVVPPRWLTEQLRMEAEGAQAIAGSIEVADWSEWPPGLDERFLRFYEPPGSDETHGHVHGANFGVRADAYLAAGGFEPLATGEDHALWRALQRVARPRVSSRTIAVRTSARAAARAPSGFSGFLAALAVATGSLR